MSDTYTFFGVGDIIFFRGRQSDLFMVNYLLGHILMTVTWSAGRYIDLLNSLIVPTYFP